MKEGQILGFLASHWNGRDWARSRHTITEIVPSILHTGWSIRFDIGAGLGHWRLAPKRSGLKRRRQWYARSISPISHAFEVSSKRRKGYPSETRVKRGLRFVHGDVELVEKLGRNDPCPCGSGLRF
jgi:hypothetical protein